MSIVKNKIKLQFSDNNPLSKWDGWNFIPVYKSHSSFYLLVNTEQVNTELKWSGIRSKDVYVEGNEKEVAEAFKKHLASDMPPAQLIRD